MARRPAIRSARAICMVDTSTLRDAERVGDGAEVERGHGAIGISGAGEGPNVVGDDDGVVRRAPPRPGQVPARPAQGMQVGPPHRPDVEGLDGAPRGDRPAGRHGGDAPQPGVELVPEGAQALAPGIEVTTGRRTLGMRQLAGHDGDPHGPTVRPITPGRQAGARSASAHRSAMPSPAVRRWAARRR